MEDHIKLVQGPETFNAMKLQNAFTEATRHAQSVKLEAKPVPSPASKFMFSKLLVGNPLLEGMMVLATPSFFHMEEASLQI